MDDVVYCITSALLGRPRNYMPNDDEGENQILYCSELFEETVDNVYIGSDAVSAAVITLDVLVLLKTRNYILNVNSAHPNNNDP